MTFPLDGSPLPASKRLLVACDYDGTLTPIVAQPEWATPDADLIELLRSLCASPGITAAVISGRSLEQLEHWLPLPDLVLVGGHGAEWRRPGFPPCRFLAPAGIDQRAERIANSLGEALRGVVGARVERKRFSVAAHFRHVPATSRPAFDAGFEEVAASFKPEFAAHEGKKVRELRPAGVDKGRALVRLRAALWLEDVPALVLGDDATDEEGFASLGAGDISVKIGEGDTRADHRLPNPGAARMLLADLLRRREEMLS